MKLPSDVAVVVVSHNTRDLLLECLASIIESTSGSQTELVVVDNASTDGSYQAVSRAFPHITLISNETNLGFGPACNQGITATGGKLVLLLNSDARINDRALNAMVNVMRSDDRCGAAGCAVLDAHGKPAVNTRNFLTPWNHALEYLGVTTTLKNIRSLCRTHRPNLARDETDCTVDWIEASCLLLRRTALDEVGLFDERFFMYSEDEDLCFRLKRQGWLICCTGAGSVLHHGGASTEHSRLVMLQQFYKSQLMFLDKHRGRKSILLYFWILRVTLILKQFLLRLRRRRPRTGEPAERLSALRRAYTAWRLEKSSLIPHPEPSKGSG